MEHEEGRSIPTRTVNLTDHEDEAKLIVLRGLAAEAFDALDREDAVTIETDDQLVDFIRRIGKRVGLCAERSPDGQ